MIGWILFTAVISLVIGIVLGWILCTWGLANCIYDGSKVYKYPVANIWRVEDKRTTYAEPK